MSADGTSTTQIRKYSNIHKTPPAILQTKFEYKHNLQLYIAETKVRIEDLQLPQVDTEESPN